MALSRLVGPSVASPTRSGVSSTLELQVTSLGTRLTRFSRSFRRPGRTVELFVDPAGTVPCPIRGDVGIETCLACAQLSDVSEGTVSRIRCEVPGRVPAAASHPGL